MSLLPSAIPMQDRIRLIPKHVKEAQELDGADRPIEAYVKYLSCMQSIVQMLLDDAVGGEGWTLKPKSRDFCFKLLEETLSRASANVDLAYKKRAMLDHKVPDVITPGVSSPGFFPPRLNSTDPTTTHGGFKKDCFLSSSFCKNSSLKKSPSYSHAMNEVDSRNRYLQQIHTTLSCDNFKRTSSTKLSMNLEVARRMEENKDLSDKRVKILQEKRDRLKEEARAQEDYHMSVHQVSLKQRVENFSKRNRWIVVTQRHFRSLPHNTDREKSCKEFSSGVLRLNGHPVCQILSQYQIEIFAVISSIYSKLHQAGDFPTLTITCNLPNSSLSDSIDLRTEELESPTDSCVLDFGSMAQDDQTGVIGKVTHGNLGCMRQIQPEVTRKVLNKVSEQILSKIDFLEFSLLDCYPDLVPYKAICRESVEEVFLHALWVPLLSLFRCKNLEQELALANQMASRLNEPPSAFDIPRHLCLWDDVTNFNHIPYSSAINKLKLLSEQYSLSEKVSCLNESSHSIITCIEDYQTQERIKNSSSSVGTDDLLPIMCFTVLRSCTPQLLSECEMIGSLLPENALFGETGFCLSTIQTALNYLVVRQMNGSSH